MSGRLRGLAAVGAAAVVALGGGSVLAACTSSQPAAVSVSLAEWAVKPSTDRIRAGDVVFTVKNDGTEEHEMLVVRSDAAAGDLPVVNGEIDEASIESLGEVPETAVGATGTLRLDALPKGHYILLCNIPGHYSKGMYTDFTVD